MLKIRMAAFVLLASILSSFVLAPAAPAAAQPAVGVPNPFMAIPVTGTVANGGTFSGTLDVTHFAQRASNLVAQGALSGTLRDASGNVIGTVADQAVNVPVNALQATCQILHLELGPLDLNLLGLRVQLNRVVLDITAEQGPGNLLGNLLCALVGLLDPPGHLNQIINLLNQILQIFNSPFIGIPVTGAVENGGTFSGILTVAEFARQNGSLVAQGTLDGTLRDANGNIIGTVADQAVTLPVAAIQATCRILHLELGPLDLNLLGLRVQLNRVVLDITAIQGPGNLLGNLLCALAGLLDNTPPPLAGIANLLNAILRIF